MAYDLRKKNLCKLPKAKPTSYGVESLSFRGSFHWSIFDDKVKQEPTLTLFRNKIRIGPENAAPAEYAVNITGYDTGFKYFLGFFVIM